MLYSLFLLVCGFVLLAAGAELLVRGCSRLALRLGITPLFVGLTIVAFGTSAPELVVSIEAAMNGSSAIALGNIIGSNIANIGLILGITALISPIRVESELLKRQIPLMIGVSLFLCLLLLDGQIGLIDGIILVLGLAGFIVWSYRGSDSSLEPVASSLSSNLVQIPSSAGQISYYIGFIIGGLALLIAGSNIFVASAITVAQFFGVSEATIGLTVVAVGTSIPEFATSLVAAVRKQSAIALGNIVGSNIFNILGILGVTTFISPISALDFSVIDLAVMVLFAGVLLPYAWSNLTLSRLEGCLLLTGYTGYITYLVVL
ncbi:MAG: calcium/sodium antiporter [Nitrosospira sp.]|nr:calcium/sodium antiporter [Nitrosospira sp.]